MRFVPLSEIEGPALRFVPLEAPVASAASAPLSGTMAGFEPVEAVTPVTPPAPVEAGPILPPQASLASLGRRVAEPAEPLRSPEETVTPMAAQPVTEPAKPAEPVPYRSRAEALDDAVNLLEEGADKNQVIEGFKKLGIEWPEIVSHGQRRGSELFRQQAIAPGELSAPSGELRRVEPTFLESTANTFKRADANLKDLSTSLLFSTGALSPDDAAQLIRRQARQRGAAAPSEEIQQGLEAIGGAKTYGDAAEAMLRNPRATLSLLVDSLLVTAPALAATALTGPARPAAAFAASASMEYAAVMGDVLQDKGIDLTDASKVAGALQNPEIIAEMKEKGAKRGLIIGTFDAISMGMAGRFLRPANELIAAGKLSGAAAKKATIAAWSKELALQMGTGAGGEFAAQQATGENKPAEVLLEGIAEGVTAPVDVAAALRQSRSSTREAQIARAIEEGVSDTDFTREGIRREGAAAAAGIRPTTIAELARTLPVAPPEGPGEPSAGAVTLPSGRAEPSLGAEPAAAVAAEPQMVTEPTVAPGRTEPRLGPPSAPPPSPPLPPSEPPTPPTPAPVTPVTRPVAAIPGMPTGEEVEDLEVTPVTPAAKPPEEAVTPATPVASFTTAKGSTYEVTPEGQTIRTKRSAGKGQGETYPPHTALYVQPGDHMEILSDLQGGMGGNAVRLGYVADNKFVPIQTTADLPEDAQPTVGVFNRKTGAVVNLYKADTTPAEGLHPVEKLYTPDGQSSTHIGNQIVSVQRVTPVTLTEEVTKPVTEVTQEVTPVTPTFTPTQAAARLPETPTVAPITKPKEFEPATVDLESDGMPTVEAPLTQLKLSEDVPQFKIGATAEGIVEPLGGKFERTGVAPIQVWRRLDGSLEVISGRHRFDLAKRSGEKTIPAQIHDEAKGFNKLQASILDAELNIRDGQGKVKDYVNYFKESGITKQDADARGLLARATGKRSYAIATQGSDELIAAVRADQIGDEAAFYIALNAPSDARLQSVGIKAIQDGKSMNTATNMMQAVKALAGETDTTLDMFGFDDSAIREAEEMAKLASQKQREIQTRLSAISGAAKNPALAKAEGIDVRDPEAIKRRIEELRQRKIAWDNWSTSPELVAEIRAARGVEPPAPTIVEEPPAGPSLFDEDLLTAPTPEDIRAKEEADARRARETAEAERKAKADEARGDFVLTGSDRAADEAAARGQMELGAQPEPGTTVDENDPGFRGASDEEVKDVADAFKGAAERQDADKVTRVLDAPNKGEIVRIENKAKIFVKDAGYLTVAQAKQRIAEWKNNAQSQGEDRRNSEKIVLSLFDMTGEWSKPWEDAGYQVYRFDIQTDPEFGDVNKFSSEFFNDMYGAFEGQDVYAILAACPCTDFASSGARHFAAKDADGRTIESVELVQQTLATIEYFKPSVWAIENPVGRIEKLTSLPPWRMSFNPNHFGDPYTKKTLLWGRFNADLPIAPVEPTEGSKMHRMYGGKSKETKNARSVTPEGFAYAFFQANNAIDNPVMAIANKYDMMDRAVFKEALDAGLSEKQITEIVDDPYYFSQDYRQAEADLREAIGATKPAAAPTEPPNIRLARKELKESERDPGKELTPAQLKRRRELIAYEKAQGVTGVTTDTVVNNEAPPADLPADNRLVLMPCCAKKGAKAAPAMELYKGVFFQSFASNVKPGAQPNVIILSAKHGFIDPTKQIEPYDQVMTPTRAKEMLSNLGAELAKVTWPTNIQDVLIVGGKEYQQVMRAALADLVNAGRIPNTASINVTSGGIGEQRQQLNNYLQSIPAEAPEDAALAEEAAPTPEQYTPEQRKNAEVHAKELGGEIVWQRGDNALIRGYALLTGAPVYIATAGNIRARMDIDSFAGKQVPDDVKQEMSEAKKRLEAGAEEKHQAAPFITFQDGLAMSQDIPEQLAGVIKEWKSLLKLDVPIYVSTIEDARTNRNNFTGPHRAIGSGTLDANELGSMRMMPDSSYYILFDKSTSPTKMLETIAHEMGHVHQRLFYERASQEEKDALRDAHKKWLESQKGKTAQEMITSMRARATGRAVPVREDMQSNELSNYWRLFGEWYADQTARWALSSARPVTIVEKYFKRLGVQLRRFFQQLQARKYLPNETFAQYIEKATGGPAGIEPAAPGIGAAVMGERMMNAANRFRKATMNQFKLTQEQADAAMGKLIKEKVLTLDPVTGQFELKDGRFWNREVMLRAAEAQQGVKLMNIPEKKKLPPGRSPELSEAAQQLQRGEITAQKFDELVNRYRPIPVYFAPLQPATSEQVYNALDSAKRDKIDPKIPAGYPVGLRLDIPAFNRAGVFVVSIHEKRTPSSPGKVIGYSSAASIKNVTFGLGNQREALKIAAGSAKDAIQTMEGTFAPITADQAYQMADNAILSGDWVQVGFDPTRHAYFFDRSSTMPVVAADEVIQIGNMILAKGVTYGRKEDFLYDVTGRPAAPEPSLMTQEGDLIVGREAVREYQIKEYAALRKKLAGVAKKVAEGEVDIDVQRNTTEMMQKSRELQSAIKSSKPRVDTPEAFLAKALQEYDKGNIDKDVLDVIQAAYGKQPELLDGLLLSVRKGAGEAVGSFDPMRRIVYLYKSTSGTYEPRTIRHELSHSLEQMMTPEQRMVVVQAWGKALARAIKQNPDELHQRYFNAILKFLDNPSQRTLNNAQMLLPGYEMYQFINPSEYWAVNAERLMASQLGTAWDRFKRAVQQLFEGLKKVLGFDNQYDVHRVFGQVMKGSKERITRETLVDIVMSSVGDGSQFVTLNNIEPAKNLKEKYSRPNTPMLDTTPISTFVTKQFKNGKEYFKEAAANPSMVGNDVINGLIAMRNQNIWYGSGLEARDFAQYNGALKTSNGFATASVALDNAIRGGNIGTEVIFRGGIEFNKNARNFVAVKRDMGMRGVYEAEKALKDRIGDQLGTDTIQGYLEAKRSISIMTELYTREAALDAAKARRDLLQSMGAEPDEIAMAKEAVEQAEQEVASIKKAASSVNMSEEEMYEFAALEEEYPELRTIMDNWTAINQNLLTFWRQVGLLSQGRYETLAAIKDYVPWYRIMDDEKDLHDQSEIQSTTRTMTNIGREKLFKRGRPIAVVDFRATQGQTDFKIQPSSVVQVEVNGKKVDPALVTTTPEGDVRLDLELNENDLVVFKTNREIQNIIDNMTRNVMRMTMNGLRQFAANRIVLEYATRNEKGKVMTFPSVDRPKGRFNWTVNGKKVVVEISDPLVAEAIYGMDNINLRMWAPLAAVANLTRRSITLSGAFQLKQVFKDAPTAALVTGVKNPLALIGGVWKGFLTSLTNTDPVVDILKAAGIGGFHSPARTPEAEIKRRLGIMNGNIFDFVIKGLDHIGDSSDMAQRVATYKRVLKETGDETQALYQAANVINFLHHGSAGYAQAMVKVVPFMGAYLNSSDVLIRALAGSGLKGVSRKKALLRLGVTTGLLTGATLLYCMLAGADPEYDELDDQTKLRNVMIPGTKIMMPMNTSAAFIFKAIPELIYNAVTREGTENELDRRRVRKALADAARDMLLGPEPVPAGVKPVLEVLLDRNFYTGRTVIPEGLKDVEAAKQYTASTSELGKALSALMSIPGTDDKRMLSPIEADHLVRGIFGSAGAMAQWASNSIGVIAETRPEPTGRETPVIGGFLREDIPRGREDLFYDFKKEVFEKYKTWSKMVDEEDFDAADAYLDKHGDIVGMYQYINQTEEELGEINKEIRRVGASRSKDMTPKERREEIDELRRIKLDILEPVKELRREIFR